MLTELAREMARRATSIAIELGRHLAAARRAVRLTQRTIAARRSEQRQAQRRAIACAEFCATHLPHLDEVAWSFFGSSRARDAFREKVAALYPEHEVEKFTELFWNRVQQWRADKAV